MTKGWLFLPKYSGIRWNILLAKDISQRQGEAAAIERSAQCVVFCSFLIVALLRRLFRPVISKKVGRSESHGKPVSLVRVRGAAAIALHLRAWLLCWRRALIGAQLYTKLSHGRHLYCTLERTHESGEKVGDITWRVPEHEILHHLVSLTCQNTGIV